MVWARVPICEVEEEMVTRVVLISEVEVEILGHRLHSLPTCGTKGLAEFGQDRTRNHPQEAFLETFLLLCPGGCLFLPRLRRPG